MEYVVGSLGASGRGHHHFWLTRPNRVKKLHKILLNAVLYQALPLSVEGSVFHSYHLPLPASFPAFGEFALLIE